MTGNRYQAMAVLVLAAGLCCAGCAGVPLREDRSLKDLRAARELFAAGQYRESLEGCLALAQPGSAALDQALYYAAFNSLRLEPGAAGSRKAAQYLRRLVEECPQSPLAPEAQALLFAFDSGGGNFGSSEDANGDDDNGQGQPLLKKKNREIRRLRGEVDRLNRELDQLKSVDMLLHQQKKDRDNGADQGDNSRR